MATTYLKRHKMDAKRKVKLLRKIQKAHVMQAREVIFSAPTWNKRFGAVARLRVSPPVSELAGERSVK
jgi:hypothetical protein